MKYLIFSDAHLTEKFNQKKFEFLKKIVASASKVIIAGDFYDQYFTNLDDFLNSEWQMLFKLLKEKKAVYIPGNHDLLNGDGRECAFCDEISEEYQFESGGEKFIVRHGDKIAPGFSRFERILPKSIRNFFTTFENRVEKCLIKIFGWSSGFFFIYRCLDLLKTINYNQKNKNDNWLILGHIHLPYFNKNIKYVNIGFINHGLASYLVIEDGEVELRKERY